MKKNQLNLVIIILICLGLLAIVGLIAFQKHNSASKLESFTVEKPNFVVKGQNLGRVEVWGIPTGTNVAESQYLHLTNMLRATSTPDSDEQVWTAAIPVGPLILSHIYAVAFDTEGVIFASSTLPYNGATEIYNALWSMSPKTSTTSTSTTTR